MSDPIFATSHFKQSPYLTTHSSLAVLHSYQHIKLLCYLSDSSYTRLCHNWSIVNNFHQREWILHNRSNNCLTPDHHSFCRSHGIHHNFFQFHQHSSHLMDKMEHTYCPSERMVPHLYERQHQWYKDNTNGSTDNTNGIQECSYTLPL